MIRAYDTAYKVDGRALLAPDEGVEISLSDRIPLILAG